MTPRETFALKVNERFFYGWVIVALGALGIFASGPGQSHIFSVYYRHIAADLDLSYFWITVCYTGATLMMSFALPLLGKRVDRYGPRRVLLIVGALFSVAVFAFSAVDHIVLLALAFAALRFLGQGSLMLCSNNMVSQWFSRKRGLALSILSWGFALSMALHPIVAEWLSATIGWRQSWMILAIATALILLPAVWWFAHDKPEDLDLLPDGDRDDTTDPARRRARAPITGLTLAEARKEPTFWVVTFSLTSLAGLVTALFLNQVTILSDQGLASIGSVSMGSALFFVTAVTMIVCVPMIGRLLDRYRPERVFACALLTMSAALVAINFATNLYMAVLYAIVFGLANASIHAHAVFLWGYYFGRKHLGSIQGFGQSLAVIGASVLPLPFALAYDMTGEFTIALYVCALIPIVLAVFAWNMKRPVIPEPAE